MRHANPCLGRFLAQAWQASWGSSHCDRDDEKDGGDDDGGDDTRTRIASNPIETRATVIRMMIYIMPMRGFGTKIPQFCQKNDPKHRAPKPATSSVSLRLGRRRWPTFGSFVLQYAEIGLTDSKNFRSMNWPMVLERHIQLGLIEWQWFSVVANHRSFLYIHQSSSIPCTDVRLWGHWRILLNR